MIGAVLRAIAIDALCDRDWREGEIAIGVVLRAISLISADDFSDLGG